MNDVTFHLTGNLTADPEMRYTPSGTAVCNFTVAATPRRFDKATGGWVDRDAIFMRCTAWKQLAEHIAESAVRGQTVMVSGELETNSYETREGEKRTSLQLTVREFGISLKFGTAKYSKAERSGGGQSQQDPPASDDPWANVRGPQDSDAPPLDDEPPF
jgi:single-strand DNA-binding protein